MNRAIPSLVLALGVLLAQASAADTLLIDRVHAEAGLAMPKRGASMASVESHFGAPQQKVAAVGGESRQHPPISRWVYANFTVYFENSHVVDAVANQVGPNEIGPAPVHP